MPGLEFLVGGGGGLSVDNLLEALEENDVDVRTALGLGDAALADVGVTVASMTDARIEQWATLGIAWVFHGTNADKSRPSVPHVIWVGTVLPKKYDADDDLWFNPTGAEVEE